jgi:hypothetical protein
MSSLPPADLAVVLLFRLIISPTGDFERYKPFFLPSRSGTVFRVICLKQGKYGDKIKITVPPPFHIYESFQEYLQLNTI